MQPDKWLDIKNRILDNFPVDDQGVERFDEQGGVDVEFVVFQGPMGKMKLEYISKPVILDRKTSFSRRLGSESKVDYIYSETEKSHQLVVYRWDEALDDWSEIEAKKFSFA